jgi:hypothetical protein
MPVAQAAGQPRAEGCRVLDLEGGERAPLPFPEADALRKVEQAFNPDHGDAAIWDWLGVHPCNDRGNAGMFVDKHRAVIRYVPSKLVPYEYDPDAKSELGHTVFNFEACFR